MSTEARKREGETAACAEMNFREGARARSAHAPRPNPITPGRSYGTASFPFILVIFDLVDRRAGSAERGGARAARGRSPTFLLNESRFEFVLLKLNLAFCSKVRIPENVPGAAAARPARPAPRRAALEHRRRRLYISARKLFDRFIMRRFRDTVADDAGAGRARALASKREAVHVF